MQFPATLPGFVIRWLATGLISRLVSPRAAGQCHKNLVWSSGLSSYVAVSCAVGSGAVLSFPI